MNTRKFVVIFTVAFIAFSLTACSGDAARETASFVADATYSESIPASVMALKDTPRVENCGASSMQGLINEMKSQVNSDTGVVDGYSIGEWLSEQMLDHNCIVSIDDVNN